MLTLNVLPAYRSQGLGAHLLEHVVSKATAWSPPAAAAEGGPASKTRAASKEQGQAAERKVEAVLVYCQVGNEQAKAFYTQKAGFVEKETCVSPFALTLALALRPRLSPLTTLPPASPSPSASRTTTTRSSPAPPSCSSAN